MLCCVFLQLAFKKPPNMLKIKFAMNTSEVHVGRLIKLRMKEKNMTAAQLGAKINRSREAVRCMLKRKSINTDLLLELCLHLDYDFFSEYSRAVSETND